MVKLSEVQKCKSPLENFHMVSSLVTLPWYFCTKIYSKLGGNSSLPNPNWVIVWNFCRLFTIYELYFNSNSKGVGNNAIFFRLWKRCAVKTLLQLDLLKCLSYDCSPLVLPCSSEMIKIERLIFVEHQNEESNSINLLIC